MSEKFVHIMRGTTLSGKTTYVNQIWGENNPNVLSSDYFREMLTGDAGNQEYNKKVFNLLYDVFLTRLRNNVDYTVLDMTSLKYWDVHAYIDDALVRGYTVKFHSLSPPSKKELIRRNDYRFENGGIYIPERVIDKHLDRYYDGFFEEKIKEKFSSSNIIWTYPIPHVELNND